MLTQRQLEMRRTGIGASEAAVPAGYHPFVTGLDIVNEKTLGLMRPETPAMTAGSFLEAAGARMYEAATGEKLWRDTAQTRRHKEHSWMLASVDYQIVRNRKRGKIVEVKMPLRRGDYYGYDSDAVPPYVHFQVQQQMEVYGQDEADVFVFFLASREPVIYGPIERNDRLINRIIEINGEWWQRHIVDGVPLPIDGSKAADIYLRETFGDPSGEVVAAPDEAEEYARAYAQALADIRDATERKDLFGNQLRAVIGNYDGVAGYWGQATWKPQRGRPDWKAIAQEYRNQLELRGALAAELDETIKRHTPKKVRVLRVKYEDALGEEEEDAA